MFDWVLYTPLACLKKEKNCEKPVKELILAKLQQRLEIISKRFLRKTLQRHDFLQLFSAGFVRNPEVAIRGVL